MGINDALSNIIALQEINNEFYAQKYYTPISEVFLDLKLLSKVILRVKDLTLPKSRVLHTKKHVYDKPYYESLYIPEVKTLSNFQNKFSFIHEFTKTLKKLHQIHFDQNFKWFSIDNKLEKFYKLINKRNEEINKLFSIANQILGEISKFNLPYCLCHNDLVNGNILWWKSSIKLIDFDFSSINYRLFDICSFVSENALSKNEKLLFLKKMNLNHNEQLCFEKMINIQNILWSFWSLYYYEKTKKDTYLNIIKIKLSNSFSSSFLNRLYHQ